MNLSGNQRNIENQGSFPAKLERVISSTVDFAPGDYEVLILPGAWGRERYLERQVLGHGICSIGSSRGISSHQFNPFLALFPRGTTESQGEVHSFNLVYSGNFAAEVEKNQDGRIRMNMGINPLTKNPFLIFHKKVKTWVLNYLSWICHVRRW